MIMEREQFQLLDTEAWAIPEQIYLSSKDDDHLPVINLTKNPISIDVKEKGEQHP